MCVLGNCEKLKSAFSGLERRRESAGGPNGAFFGEVFAIFGEIFAKKTPFLSKIESI